MSSPRVLRDLPSSPTRRSSDLHQHMVAADVLACLAEQTDKVAGGLEYSQPGNGAIAARRAHRRWRRVEIGRAHVLTPVTDVSRMPSSARKKKFQEMEQRATPVT